MAAPLLSSIGSPTLLLLATLLALLATICRKEGRDRWSVFLLQMFRKLSLPVCKMEKGPVSGWEWEDYKAAQGNFGRWWLCVVMLLWCVQLSNLTTLHALHVCSLLYVSYPSMKLYFNGDSDTHVSPFGT